MQLRRRLQPLQGLPLSIELSTEPQGARAETLGSRSFLNEIKLACDNTGQTPARKKESDRYAADRSASALSAGHLRGKPHPSGHQLPQHCGKAGGDKTLGGAHSEPAHGAGHDRKRVLRQNLPDRPRHLGGKAGAAGAGRHSGALPAGERGADGRGTVERRPCHDQRFAPAPFYRRL